MGTLNHKCEEITSTYTLKSIPGITTARNGIPMKRCLQLAQGRYVSKAEKQKIQDRLLQEVHENVSQMHNEMQVEIAELKAEVKEKDSIIAKQKDTIAQKDKANALTNQENTFLKRQLELMTIRNN